MTGVDLLSIFSLLCFVQTIFSANIDGDFWDMQPFYNRIYPNGTSRTHTSSTSESNPISDLILAVPDGAVIGVLPKLGWIIYEGENNEEVDFRLESEFLYRFPRSRTSQVSLERSLSSPTSNDRINESYHQRLHRRRREIRESRLVRDKKLIYKGLGRMFRNFGMDGEICTHRAICEISSSPLLHDGIIGELLNIALIPSHKFGQGGGLEEFRDAENAGREGNDCSTIYSRCPVSIFKTLQL